MTLSEIENRVMSRLGLTSSEQRARVRDEINDRYRQVTSSLNMAPSRRGSVTFTTASGNPLVVASGVTLLETIYDPTTRKRPLSEVPLSLIRQVDPGGDRTGPPESFATYTMHDDVLTLYLFPKPDAVYALPADVLLTGTDMTEASDSPAFESDFHDILVHGAIADEYLRDEKVRPQAAAYEAKFGARLSELLLHRQRKIWLSRQVTDPHTRGPFGAQRSTEYRIV